MKCPNCDGTGIVIMEIWSVKSHQKINEFEVECPQCKGAKTVEDATKSQLAERSSTSNIGTGTTEEILLLVSPSSNLSSGET